MPQSILTQTKKLLGLVEDDTSYDIDIVIHINTVFATLNELGIGPAEGFMIEDKTTTWDAFLGAGPLYNAVKTYMYLRLRLIFDPPTTSYGLESFKEQIKEFEWRMNVIREGEQWVDPTLPVAP
ncbi:hypothetical protein SEA_CRICKO_5 [Streptomyces phage CricKo]|nr:hypothetical protein SEA_RAINYDAI_5 [Streptomyces phage Rainydai]AWN06108.1 hypothetical protein SEA_SENDITCS_5 [Streptomyces phage SendItCS]QJD49888.1 hypothetical protein SEA_CRICKO_5 [Streptomyces phage CricKo]QNL30620.1 hypothetical protein SEA_THIQQUMS_5 [Streptomyces phage Thiqqums]WIC89342.1 hypothetical protein SEA_MIEK_5 [Streptomyces phage Miek]